MLGQSCVELYFCRVPAACPHSFNPSLLSAPGMGNMETKLVEVGAGADAFVASPIDNNNDNNNANNNNSDNKNNCSSNNNTSNDNNSNSNPKKLQKSGQGSYSKEKSATYGYRHAYWQVSIGESCVIL